MAEIPSPVGWYCDHTDEPPGARTHEGWDWDNEDGRVWTKNPDTISAHTGTTDWDPQQRRCPRAVPVYSIDAPALSAQVERLTADAAGWRTAYDRLAAQARRFRWAYMSARRGRRSARLLNQELTTSYERTLRIVQAERDEARAQRDAVAAAAEADDQRNANALADYQAKVTELTGELYEIRTRDETVGGVLYDVVRRAQTGQLDDHQAVRAIEQRLIHPLVAKLQEARAKASLGAGRRRTSAAQLSSVRAERDAARAEVEERGKALADWQRVAGQHQAAMFDAKNRAEQLDKAVTFLTEVLAGTVLVGADDAIGMLHELVTVLVDLDELTADQAARVKDGLDAQRADRGQLRQLVRDLTDPAPCYFDHHGGCQAHGYLSLKPGEKCPHAEAKELLGTETEPAQDGGARG